MSISGNLLDVSIADVMQFVHLGGRTGTLVVESLGRKGEVGFHRGRIINAWVPETKKLGDLLYERGLIDEETLNAALRRQTEDSPRDSLGKILVSMKSVTPDGLRDVVAEQIERTVYELVTWNQGRFEFALDELRPVDDIAVYPGDILPDIHLNTQMVVLEALRIFDEKNRTRIAELGEDGEAEESSPDRTPPTLGAVAARTESLDDVTQEIEASLAQAVDEERTDATGSGATRFQVVTADHELIRGLSERLPEDVELGHVELWDAGLTLPGESPPIVLVDLRPGGATLGELEKLRRARAHASIIAVAHGALEAAQAYEAGALALLPPDAKAVVACLDSILRNRRGRDSLTSERHGTTAGFAKLKRVVADLRSGLLSATVALNLMQVISESVERAIMFLVRGDSLVALGAFGFHPDGESLATTTHDCEVPIAGPSALAQAVSDGQTRSLRFEEADMATRLEESIGRPRTGQVVIFPVIGSDRVRAVVYTDNGKLSREIEEIEILELAAAQVGVAFENELLRRQIDGAP